MNRIPLTQIATKDGVQSAWLRQSFNDFEMAQILLPANKRDCTCYHAQQSVGKLLRIWSIITSSMKQLTDNIPSRDVICNDCKFLEVIYFHFLKFVLVTQNKPSQPSAPFPKPWIF